MRSILLTAITVIVAAGSLSAQSFRPDYPFEFGISGGMGVTTIPTGPASQYTGAKTMWNGTYGANFNYNLSDNWQVGGDINIAKWTTTANWAQTGAEGQVLDPKKVTFSIANPAMSFMAHFNRMEPMYSSYREYIKSNFYYGVSLGLVTAVNDGSMGYSPYKDAPALNYTYVSQYDYGMGVGVTAGIQVGYTYYVIEHLGINLEVAGRYVNVGTNDTKYDHANSKYNLIYFPCTLGLRYRL